MSDNENEEVAQDASTDSNEAKKAMEEAKRARAEKQAAEMAEYEASRSVAREKEEEEIRLLREKRLQRQREREEDEKRLAGLRAAEEVKRKAEEEERRRKKIEEEQNAKDERDRKRKEAEERLRPKGRNFTISKKSDSEKPDGEERHDPIYSKEELQKSKEQLEEEKRAILSQRIQPLSVDGLESDKLVEKAKEIQEHIRHLEGDRYDLEQRYKRQQYDMIELAERARQMNKGKGRRGVKAVQVDESFDRLADKYTSAPPKIQLCSKYERHTDHRTYLQRMTLFEELAKEVPPPELKRVGGGGGGTEAEEEEDE